MTNKKLSKDAKEERIGMLIGRLFLLGLAIVVVLTTTVFKPDCTSNEEVLGCHITGTWGDWVGIPLFTIGLLYLSGIFKGTKNLYSPPGSTSGNLVFFVLMVIAAVLVYFA